jgi:iron complex outermembrane receptor protein
MVTSTEGTFPYLCGELPRAGRGPAANTPDDALTRSVLGNRSNLPDIDAVDGYGLTRDFKHFQAVISYDFSDSISITSFTGYTDDEVSELDDLDNWDGALVSSGIGDTSGGYWSFPFLVERDLEDFSQEIRVDYAGEDFEAMLGASYLKTEAGGTLLSVSFASPDIPNSPTAKRAPEQAKTTSIFGSVSYDFNEKLSVSAEARYQEDEIFLFSGGRGLTLVDGNAFGLDAGEFEPFQEVTSVTFSNFLPRVIAEYQATEDMFVYASWSEAANILQSSFNTSFINGSAAERELGDSIGLGVIVQPEELENFEVGMKSSFLDGKLIAQAAAYWATWTNQHNNRTVFGQEPDGTPLIVAGRANTGESDLFGIEIDITARATDELTFGFSAAMNDSEYVSFADPQVELSTGLTGDDFKGNQEWRQERVH